jgi:hypothetical protein
MKHITLTMIVLFASLASVVASTTMERPGVRSIHYAIAHGLTA